MNKPGWAALGVLLAAGAVAAGHAPAPATHEVRMLMDGDSTFRFEPAGLTVEPGDRVRFRMVSGGPHNVAFRADQIPAAARARLAANMPDQISPLAGPLLTRAGQSYVVSFAGIEPGEYPYFCMPHAVQGMEGTITVARRAGP